ncbi:hypothetical protein QTP88_022198 [Uroleucon formosanum]
MYDCIDLRNDSSAIIFLPYANIIHTTRTCVSGHKMKNIIWIKNKIVIFVTLLYVHTTHIRYMFLTKSLFHLRIYYYFENHVTYRPTAECLETEKGLEKNSKQKRKRDNAKMIKLTVFEHGDTYKHIPISDLYKYNFYMQLIV